MVEDTVARHGRQMWHWFSGVLELNYILWTFNELGLVSQCMASDSNTAQGLESFTQFAPGATVKNEFRFFFYGLPFVQNIVMVRMFLLLCSLCAAVFRPNSLSHVSSCCTTMAKEHFKWKIGWGT